MDASIVCVKSSMELVHEENPPKNILRKKHNLQKATQSRKEDWGFISVKMWISESSLSTLENFKHQKRHLLGPLLYKIIFK